MLKLKISFFSSVTPAYPSARDRIPLCKWKGFNRNVLFIAQHAAGAGSVQRRDPLLALHCIDSLKPKHIPDGNIIILQISPKV